MPRSAKAPRQQLLEAAERGDLNTIIGTLATPPADLFLDQGERLAALRRAIQANSNEGLRPLIEAVLRTVMAFDTELLMLQQINVRGLVNEGTKRYGAVEGPRCVPEAELAKLQRLEIHVVQLAKQVATIQHVLAVSEEAKTLRRNRDAKRKAARLRLVNDRGVTAYANAAGG